VESVAFAAERKDVLSAFFWLVTMLAYTRYVRKPGKLSYGLVIVAFALALMSKPMPVSLPIVLLLMDWWPLGRIERSSLAAWKPLVWEKAPLFALSAASCVITFLAQRATGAVVTIAKYPLDGRIENAVVSYAKYLLKTVWPTKLMFFYPYDKHLPVWQVAAAACLLAGVTWLVFGPWRARRYAAAGWLWYLVTLLPVIGLVQAGEQSMADRYTYVPLIGAFIVIAWGIADIVPRDKAALRSASAAACAVVLALAGFTWVQTGYWKNGVTVFRHAIDVDPNNSMAHYNLGVVLSEHGRDDEAIREFFEAVRADPGNAEAHNNLGVALGSQGMHAEALTHLKRAVKLNPRNSEAQYNLGNDLLRSEDYRGAVKRYRIALKLDPTFSTAHRNLAVAYYLLGEYRKAWAEVQLTREYGESPAESFIGALSQKMPEPGY
jgi:Flp pilus assembly protein TadD